MAQDLKNKTDIAGLVAQARKNTVGRRKWFVVATGAALVLVGGLLFLFPKDDAPRYLTQVVQRGALTVKVSTTGTLQPVTQIDVGSELSGIIESVFVDDNSVVSKGQLLARLDTSRLKDTVQKSAANVEKAQAQVAQAAATHLEAVLLRDRLLALKNKTAGVLPSGTELDAAQASVSRAVEAFNSAKAAVREAQAALNSDQTNLAKASIVSPISGMVLSRKIDPGQTVAANFQSPVLFVVAQNLAKMELEADVDEADVGSIAQGQRASFSVDAYTGQRFEGRITRVGFGPKIKDGVVTYKTLLSVDNNALKLRPGMTASAQIITHERSNATLIPAAAFRFTPTTTGSGQNKGNASLLQALQSRPSQESTSRTRSSSDASQQKSSENTQRVWVLRGGKAVPVEVVTGLSDGNQAELISGDIQVGEQVIIGQQEGN
jgi:HlyD family secretion protein